MSNRNLSITEFKHAARGALMEAELNGVRNRSDTEMADILWQYFEALEAIVKSAGSRAEEPIEGEVQ